MRDTRAGDQGVTGATPGLQAQAVGMTSSPRTPAAGQMYDELSVMITGLVAGAAIMPGFFLCVPGLALALAPLIVLGFLAVLVGLVIVLAVAPLLVAQRVAQRLQDVVAARRERSARPMSAARS